MDLKTKNKQIDLIQSVLVIGWVYNGSNGVLFDSKIWLYLKNWILGVFLLIIIGYQFIHIQQVRYQIVYHK